MRVNSTLKGSQQAPPSSNERLHMSKSGTVTSSNDAVNVELAKQFAGCFNLSAEISVYEKAINMLNGGTISVRGLKATIEAAELVGALPTIRSSHAQYFLRSASVRNLEGGKAQPLRIILNATIQAKRATKSLNGKQVSMFADLLEAAKSFADFAKSIPTQGEKAKAGRKVSKSEPLLTIDAYASLFMGAKELENQLFSDLAIAESFFKYVNALSKMNASAAHPALSTKGA